jgi:hypothetical protein
MQNYKKNKEQRMKYKELFVPLQHHYTTKPWFINTIFSLSALVLQA